ncbi:MAG: ABC transporter ATP-binding protein [Actinobacteria bacterium]|nr:ABC transporter ATP-binding protein [Actinomycetota bacterium]
MRGPDSAVRGAVVATLRLLPRVSRPLTVAMGAVMVASALVPTAFMLVSGAVIGTLPRAIAAGPSSGAADRVLVLIALAGALFALQQTTGPVLQAVAAALGRRLTLHLRRRVMAASVLPPGIAHLEDPALLDKVAMAQGVGAADISPRELAIAIAMVGSRYLAATAAAVLLAAFRWWLPIILVIEYLLVIRTFRGEFQKSAGVLVGKAEEMRRSAYFRDAALTPAAAKEVRIFGLGQWVEDRFRDSFRTAITAVRRGRRGAWRLMAWAPALFFLTELFTFVLLGRAAVRGEISLGQFTVFASAAGGVGMFASLSQYDLFLQYGAPSVLAAIDLERITAQPHIRLSGGRSSAGLPVHAIRFEAVDFNYPGQGPDRKVLDGLHLEIPAGKSLAVVGENGAGKTTLVKLLARLYDPTAGRIAVDGVDLRDLDPGQWQQRIGAIFQDFVRYQLTVADNVGFGASADVDGDALKLAAARAGALDLVDGLPVGWDTVLSRQFSGGADLSGGQWQRVALARALFAVERGAGVLVLDEPSANLDVRAEAELYDRFLELTEGLTTILISHRFSTVRRADRIVVLDGGRVVEDGSHEALVDAGGRYARMFGLQAARFAP